MKTFTGHGVIRGSRQDSIAMYAAQLNRYGKGHLRYFFRQAKDFEKQVSPPFGSFAINAMNKAIRFPRKLSQDT
ncbi:MAG: hypothetical protein HYT62_02475 [Candidatus Yanofskybacteria bacterium]|nr:hypothetical protein [Candidatus Yanofskybacteria bacterium]